MKREVPASINHNYERFYRSSNNLCLHPHIPHRLSSSLIKRNSTNHCHISTHYTRSKLTQTCHSLRLFGVLPTPHPQQQCHNNNNLKGKTIFTFGHTVPVGVEELVPHQWMFCCMPWRSSWSSLLCLYNGHHYYD